MTEISVTVNIPQVGQHVPGGAGINFSQGKKKSHMIFPRQLLYP